MSALLLLLGNRWVRYGLAAVAVLAALAIVRQHYIDVGKTAGQLEEKQRTQGAIEDTRKTERADAVAKISAKEAEAQAAGARADAAEQVAQQFADLNRTLISQRSAVAGKVNATPDTELHAGVTAALGLRPANDATAGYYPAEERSLYSCVLDRPLCAKQSEALGKEVAQHTAAIDELRHQVAAQGAQYDALSTYTVALEGHYRDAVNLFPKMKRGAHCLWLARCERTVLPVPNPDDLRRARPK